MSEGQRVSARRSEIGALVSVVVPTRQAERTLEACLLSIRGQDHQHLELVVVDNASTDETLDIARRHADLVLSGGPERSAQRNQAIARSSGPWVLWIDADMVLRPDVVSSALAAAQAHGADAVFVPEVSFGEGFWTACRALERRCYEDEPLIESPRLVRRSWLEASGGFMTTVAGQEDAELRMRLLASGAAMTRSIGVIEHDEGRLTLRGILDKRMYYGQSIPAYMAATPGGVNRQMRATLRAYVRHRRMLARDPAHAAGLLLMRGLEVLAYGAGAVRSVARWAT